MNYFNITQLFFFLFLFFFHFHSPLPLPLFHQVPVFIAEAAPSNLRGKLVTTNNLFITGGQFLASVVAGALSNTDNGWRYMLGIAAVPAVIQFIGFWYLPESPRYLYDKGKTKEAEETLIKIRGTTRIQEELNEIRESVEQESSLEPVSIKELFNSAPIRRALLVGCMLQFFQQADGINLLMYYRYVCVCVCVYVCSQYIVL